MKLITFSSIIFTILFPLYGCSSDNDDYNIFSKATIDSKYIVWEETNQKQVSKDVVLTNSDAPLLFTTPESFSLEQFSFSVKLVIDDWNDKSSVFFGKERGYMQFTPTYISFWDDSYIGNEHLKLDMGVEYTLRLTKTTTAVKFEIHNENGIIFEKSFSIYKDKIMGLMRGRPVFMIDNGSFHIINMVLETPQKQPLVNVFGDSFIEGAALMDKGISLDIRWVAQLQKNIGKEKCLIDGKGGEKMSSEFINRVMYINSIVKSKYVLLSIGTNNYSDVSGCINNMKNLAQQIKANTQIPIFATVTPRQAFSYQNTAEKINDWIRNNGELYVDMHKAVTSQDSPEWWIDGYVLPDGIHPTESAYNAMFKQLKVDCPYLLE